MEILIYNLLTTLLLSNGTILPIGTTIVIVDENYYYRLKESDPDPQHLAVEFDITFNVQVFKNTKIFERIY